MSWNLLEFIVLALISCLHFVGSVNFDRNYVGVAFGPYSKQWEGNNIPEWSSYSLQQLQCQLTLISTKFTYISTYTFGNNASLDSKVPGVAAAINKYSGSKLLSIAQGIHQFPNENEQMTELLRAFNGAIAANSIFPQTVWALTINWEDNSSIEEGLKVLNMIKMVKAYPPFQNSDLKIGARTQNCEAAILPDNLNPFPSRTPSVLEQLVKEGDYLMCNLYPDFTSSMTSVEAAVAYVASVYGQLNARVKSVNPKTELIIGETGWPSEGVAFNGVPTSVANLAHFWQQIGQLASVSGIKVLMFQGIDEPWKSDRRNGNPKDPNGVNGGEGHYGWWLQKNNSEPCQFTEKENERTFKVIQNF